MPFDTTKRFAPTVTYLPPSEPGGRPTRLVINIEVVGQPPRQTPSSRAWGFWEWFIAFWLAVFVLGALAGCTNPAQKTFERAQADQIARITEAQRLHPPTDPALDHPVPYHPHTIPITAAQWEAYWDREEHQPRMPTQARTEIDGNGDVRTTFDVESANQPLSGCITHATGAWSGGGPFTTNCW